MKLRLLAIIFAFIPTSAFAYGAYGDPNSVFTGEGNQYTSEVFGVTTKTIRSARSHKRAARSTKSRGGNIRSKTGVTARVNPAYTSRFQCLVDKLDNAGYRINVMGGYGHRPCLRGRGGRCVGRSFHESGMALDINQCYRNGLCKGSKPFPSAVNSWAASCGLLHGDKRNWPSWPDQGHFEVHGKPRAEIEEPQKVASIDPEFVPMGPLKVTKPEPLQQSDKEAIFQKDDDYNYLCTVYNRQPVKRDRSGDFTWKDPKAASLKKMTVCQYAIGGMSEKLRTSLAKLGRKLDEKGIRWSILSGFRDDYRQKIASGFKASPCRSWHGGSCLTKGYGDGRAVDVTLVGDDEDNPKAAGDIFARYASAYGLARPMPGIDPAHIQLADLGGHHRLAHRKHKRKHRYASR